MRNLILVGLVAASVLAFGSSAAHAWHISGKVLCDSNGNGSFDAGDLPVEHAIVHIVNAAGSYSDSKLTDGSGSYFFNLPDVEDTYTVTLDETTLPVDFAYLHPASGEYVVTLEFGADSAQRDWLISSATCRDAVGVCWLTGGGVKFDRDTGMRLAEKGPRHNFGGNVHPSCDPDPGEGGQWTHIAHSAKLRFQGRVITTVSCGNVPGIDPGSESPETPFNFIEYEGTGILKGIKGNKADHGTVHFFARAQDHNEPGSRGAKEGADVDRYFLHVFSDPGNPNGTTLLLVDGDGDPATVDPVTITGGNLQMHISSCDDPPAP